METGPQRPKQLALDILLSGGVPQSSSLTETVSPFPLVLSFVQIKLIFNRQTLLSYEFFRWLRNGDVSHPTVQASKTRNH